MKILFVHPSVELYGADKILLYILKMLCKKHQLTVLLPKDGILIEHIRDISLEIKVKIFNDLPIVHSKLKLADYIKLPFKILKSHSFLKNERFDYCFCNTLATIFLLFAGFSKNRPETPRWCPQSAARPGCRSGNRTGTAGPGW